MKRLFDIFFSLTGLIVLLPLFIIVALLIKMTSRGEVFYRQERVGKGFRPFHIYKFRSMNMDAHKGGPLITVSGDKRVTPVGKFLRKTKIDELPQLINVLKGDMSLVGPRPEVKKYVNMFRQDYEKILAVCPGITDPASIKFSDEETVLSSSPEWEDHYIRRVLPEKVKLSKAYVMDHGLLTDTLLIIKTILNLRPFAGLKENSGVLASTWRANMVLLADVVMIALCYVLAYFIRFEGMPDAGHLAMMFKILPVVIVAKTAVLIYFRLHKGTWQYAGIRDLTQILKAAAVSSTFIVAIAMTLQHGHSRSIFIIDWLLFVMFLSGARFIIRVTRSFRRSNGNGNSRRRKVLIAGAGDAGEMILREMIYRYNDIYEVAGLIDDDPFKHKKNIHGVTVLGSRSDIPEIAAKKGIQEVIIAIPSLRPEKMREIVDYCARAGVKYRTVPRISDLVDGKVKVKQLRDVRVEDLLRREEVLVDQQKISSYIKGKKVLITGAGGSIGSELCRQAAKLSPEQLVLFEKSENSLFYIDMELGRTCKDLKKVPVIGDICDKKRVRQVFSEFRPDIIFHAAAHKHVPLMEANPIEAVKNNVFGTKLIAEEAVRCGAGRFIMLSTDKTVDPTSVMGVSKKIAEMYVAAMAEKKKTRFMCVRFGNVLGSEGSVIPTLKRQIEKGGPVTITHPDIKRYFMTIPEAAGLVLEAGFMGRGGEIFILEMGTQIKIVELAKSLIRLSGLEPEKDIEIVFTGLRPGEKMYEALVADDEGLEKTTNERMMIVKPSRNNGRDVFADISGLAEIIKKGSVNDMLEQLRQAVPKFRPYREAVLSAIEQRSEIMDTGILVADDESIVQELLQKFLDGKGYNTITASDGRKAMDIVRGSDVRVAFVDINMPGTLDGFKVLRQIKRTNKNVKVILMTGFGTEKTKELSARLGAYGYLEKPLDLVNVKKQVEEAVTECRGRA